MKNFKENLFHINKLTLTRQRLKKYYYALKKKIILKTLKNKVNLYKVYIKSNYNKVYILDQYMFCVC